MVQLWMREPARNYQSVRQGCMSCSCNPWHFKNIMPMAGLRAVHGDSHAGTPPGNLAMMCHKWQHLSSKNLVSAVCDQALHWR